MHQCFLITEILQNILNVLSSDGCNKTIASLAITSSAFHEASLNILWYEQFSLLNLVRCMPSDLWTETDETVYFRRSPESTDWDRFKFYASKIRRLGGCLSPSANFTTWRVSLRLDTEVLTAFNNYRPTFVFLPNLRFLIWSSWNQDMFPYIQAFIEGSKLIACDFCSKDPPTNNDDTSFVLSIFSSIPRLCPSIEYLDMLPYAMPAVEPDASGLLCQLSCLRGFNCGFTLTEKALVHLAKLPHLWRLQLRLPNDINFDTLQTICPDTPFPSLRDVIIEIAIPLPGFLLKPLFMMSPLQSLGLSLNIVPTTVSIQQLLSAVSDARWHTCLEELRVEYYGPVHRPTETIDISSLFTLKNIRILIFNFPILFAIDNAWLEEASCYWPHIRELDLRDWSDLDEDGVCTSKITLDGILPLAENFRKLNSLGIILTAPSRNLEPGIARVQNNNVKILHLGLSTIEDPLKVFRFLSETFPRLETLDVWGFHGLSEHVQEIHWEQVRNLFSRKNGTMLHAV